MLLASDFGRQLWATPTAIDDTVFPIFGSQLLARFCLHGRLRRQAHSGLHAWPPARAAAEPLSNLQ
eukprot:SAG22_NODE_14_length_33165_cov_13.196698_23_plen_66_part_00